MPKHPSILVVDDNESIRVGLDMFLSEAFRVDSVSNANDALEAMRVKKFAVALVDIDLGDGNSGIWLLKELKKLRPGLQVVMVTADHKLKTILECYSLGAYGYLAKPWNNEDAKWLIRRAAERHQLVEKNAYLLARLQKYPQKQPVSRSKPSSRDLGPLIDAVSKNLNHIDRTTMKWVEEAQNELKRQLFTAALQKSGWNQSRAASLLGIKRTTLGESMKALGMSPPVLRGRL